MGRWIPATYDDQGNITGRGWYQYSSDTLTPDQQRSELDATRAQDQATREANRPAGGGIFWNNYGGAGTTTSPTGQKVVGAWRDPSTQYGNDFNTYVDDSGRAWGWLGGKANGQKVYTSPYSFGGDFGTNANQGGFFHEGPQWNQNTGRVENPWNWQNIGTLIAGGMLTAGAASALSAAPAVAATQGLPPTLPASALAPEVAGTGTLIGAPGVPIGAVGAGGATHAGAGFAQEAVKGVADHFLSPPDAPRGAPPDSTAPGQPQPSGSGGLPTATSGDALRQQIRDYLIANGGDPSETDYWVRKWPELMARGEELGNPHYATDRLAQADSLGGGASSQLATPWWALPVRPRPSSVVGDNTIARTSASLADILASFGTRAS